MRSIRKYMEIIESEGPYFSRHGDKVSEFTTKYSSDSILSIETKMNKEFTKIVTIIIYLN